MAYSQKILRKSVEFPPDRLLQIDARQCYSLSLETTSRNTLEVAAMMEGEYTRDILLPIMEEGSTLKLSATVSPISATPDDKLAAHKVVSVALRIQLPPHRRVLIMGGQLLFNVKGSYEGLTVTIEDGLCALQQVKGRVDVKTRNADILVESDSAQITAESHYGKVHDNPIPQGIPMYHLRTISGDIRLFRIE